MQTHQIKRVFKNKKPAPVGRGGKRGKTSGKGTKGQNARAGRKFRPAMRDAIKKLPKLRGYKFNSHAIKPVLVTISELEAVLSSGATVTPETLIEVGLVSLQKGKVPRVKILGTGTLTKKLSLSGLLVSSEAKKAIEKAGGDVK